MRTDVLVVGGGPAGLYAAQQLSQAGVRVRVLEEHDRIGDPVHCTGILGTEALDLPGVPRDVVLARPLVARFHSPVGHCLEYAAPPGAVCVIDRGAFDRGLAEAALGAGAEIATGTRVVGLEVHRAAVRAHAIRGGHRETASADVCLLACGARYDFQRALGWGTPPLFLGSAQTEMTSVADERVSVLLRQEVAPTGFGWLVPLVRDGEPRAKVGMMAPLAARRALRRLIDDLTSTGRVSPPIGPVVTRLLPLAPLARTHGDRILAIGDAAGLVKPTTGGGIYYSLLSAAWATDTVKTAFARGEFGATTLAEYEHTWRAHLGWELRVGVWFRRLAERLAPSDLDALTKLAITDGLMPVVRAAARFNWHHELILQAAFHPGVLQILLRRFLGLADGPQSAVSHTVAS